jgi:hypothetical protein
LEFEELAAGDGDDLLGPAAVLRLLEDAAGAWLLDLAVVLDAARGGAVRRRV